MESFEKLPAYFEGKFLPLGDANLNIATFHLGRNAAGEDAICLGQVDQPLDEAVLAHVCALPNVVQVRQLRF